MPQVNEVSWWFVSLIFLTAYVLVFCKISTILVSKFAGAGETLLKFNFLMTE